MGRRPTVLQSEFPYHIVSRRINKQAFDLPLEQVWIIAIEELAVTCENYGLQVHSFVLMKNHFHLIASTPNANISQCMRQFMRQFSVRMASASHRINETFAGRYFKSIINGTNYYLSAYKYVYRNPVAAGICDRVEHYPFSTLHAVMYHAPLQFPMVEDNTYLSDPVGTLAWLNRAPNPEKFEAFRDGLRGTYFKSKKGKDRRALFGENDLL